MAQWETEAKACRRARVAGTRGGETILAIAAEDLSSVAAEVVPGASCISLQQVYVLLTGPEERMLRWHLESKPEKLRSDAASSWLLRTNSVSEETGSLRLAC